MTDLSKIGVKPNRDPRRCKQLYFATQKTRSIAENQAGGEVAREPYHAPTRRSR